MLEILTSTTFDGWLRSLGDHTARARLLDRIDRLAEGHFGDIKAIGDGINELRVHVGPGYRLYFMRKGRTHVILLIGGDKGTQKRDIARAKMIAKDFSV